MKQQYPKNAVDALFRSASPEMLEELFPLKVPRHFVYELAEIAYHASFLTEEGRPTRFQLALLQRDRLFPGPGSVVDDVTVLELGESRKCSTKELFRLAPATDYTTTLICVDVWMHIPGRADRGLQIWGLASPGSSVQRLKRLQSPVASHVPRCLVISSTAPGHLELSLNIRTLVTLRSGTVHVSPRQPVGLPQKIVELIDARGAAFANTVEVAPNKSKVYQAWLRDRVQHKYFEVFCRLLMQLSDTHHGLTLLLVEATTVGDLVDLARVKYSTRCGRVESLLRAYFRALQGQPPTSQWDVSHDRLDDLISDALRAIANSASVDGALIVNERFDVLGFGAEILAEKAMVTDLWFATSRIEGKYSRRSVTEYGTRHRSAARFTRALPGTITFVMSQDGERKLMTDVDGNVIVWPAIEWEQIWESITEPEPPPSE